MWKSIYTFIYTFYMYSLQTGHRYPRLMVLQQSPLVAQVSHSCPAPPGLCTQAHTTTSWRKLLLFWTVTQACSFFLIHLSRRSKKKALWHISPKLKRDCLWVCFLNTSISLISMSKGITWQIWCLGSGVSFPKAKHIWHCIHSYNVPPLCQSWGVGGIG